MHSEQANCLIALCSRVGTMSRAYGSVILVIVTLRLTHLSQTGCPRLTNGPWSLSIKHKSPKTSLSLRRNVQTQATWIHTLYKLFLISQGRSMTDICLGVNPIFRSLSPNSLQFCSLSLRAVPLTTLRRTSSKCLQLQGCSNFQDAPSKFPVVLQLGVGQLQGLSFQQL